ncbi:Malate/lactate/ureidoglycolate dehydrogenase, LDH2 family [Palleronia marisminoris]|uniref:(2R)-3-sulfolactate dehydrogenase (NADP(+)) n=1 Tax=Palleronia marisminoris TaxID=315423 RepID=A0A1Y5T0S5_9RHOB|nr:Malate/lactate/ureidoglycolate dehydrogenase, LDH2 family [Palleronia marisminoris]SLN52998.1 (2R)-3-sulfolactate dehydrogenase (NADP(+)) [Palleronia marisminoris]
MTESRPYERIPRQHAADIATKILGGAGYSQAHVEVMARNMVEAQAQECHSHGLYRLVSCSTVAESGLVNLTATPEVTDRAPGVVAVDAKGGNSLLAFQAGVGQLVEKARASGIAALAVNDCFHYSALWWEVEQLSAQGLVALAMTPTHPYVAPFGGTQPLLGTNPLAFSWPRPDGEPYTFDFATSAVARGEVELRSRQGEALPEEWAIDDAGQPTTDSTKALAGALLPFGRHKGSAISTMVELMAGPLIGDLLSCQTAEPGSSARKGVQHGELVIAIDPGRFGVSLETAERLFEEISDQGARLPSERRRAAKREAAKAGLLVASHLLADLERRAA